MSLTLKWGPCVPGILVYPAEGNGPANPLPNNDRVWATITGEHPRFLPGWTVEVKNNPAGQQLVGLFFNLEDAKAAGVVAYVTRCLELHGGGA